MKIIFWIYFFSLILPTIIGFIGFKAMFGYDDIGSKRLVWLMIAHALLVPNILITLMILAYGIILWAN